MAKAYNPQVNYGYSGGAFGSNVQPVPIPQPAKDLASQFPNLDKANASASGVINSELMGQLSPDTIRMIQDNAAAQGISGGMPGSGLFQNRSLRDLGLTSMAVQRQGVQDYNSTIPTVSETQTVKPETQADINLQNATSAAAPNPTAAASYAQGLFNDYLAKLTPKTAAESMGLPNNGEFFTPAGGSGYMPIQRF